MITTQTTYEENLIKIVRTLPPLRVQQILEFARIIQERSVEAINSPAFSHQNAVDFMRLPLAERRRLLALQAEQMVDYYTQNSDERELWQGGDIVEY